MRYIIYNQNIIYCLSSCLLLLNVIISNTVNICILSAFTKEILGGVAGGILLIAILAGQLIYRWVSFVVILLESN